MTRVKLEQITKGVRLETNVIVENLSFVCVVPRRTRTFHDVKYLFIDVINEADSMEISRAAESFSPIEIIPSR